MVFCTPLRELRSRLNSYLGHRAQPQPPTTTRTQGKESKSRAQVRIRPYQNEDSEHVRNLFMQAMISGPGSPLNVAVRENLKQPLTLAVFAAFAAGLCLLPNSSTRIYGSAISLVSVAWLVFFRWFLSNAFMSYAKTSLNEDLANIGQHYQMTSGPDGKLVSSGPSGFWVAETESQDGKSLEIVGCVALDTTTEKAKKEQGAAELRRMAVSPYHRRRGIGGKLLVTQIAHARQHKVSSVILSTSSFQKAAIDMYEKHGWVEVQRQTVPVPFIKATAHTLRLDLTSG